MLQPLEEIVQDRNCAEQRLNAHLNLEADRRARGMETDEERWLAGKEVMD